jgi:branched-chain amino acid transport system ATP-binding protein
MSAGGVIEAQDLSVRYGQMMALRSFGFEAPRGAVTAVIGPNGSGKTTFLNALTGLVPYTGSVRVDGAEATGSSPGSMYRMGVSRTFQNLDLIDDLTTRENIALGAASKSRASLAEALLCGPRSRRERCERAERAEEAMELLGIAHLGDAKPKSLPYGYRRRTEVARAVASKPKAILLDEPTAGMGPTESARFAELLLHLASVVGIAVIVIEHDMAVVRACVERVYVLATGSLIAQGHPTQVLDSQVVRQVYLGEVDLG